MAEPLYLNGPTGTVYDLPGVDVISSPGLRNVNPYPSGQVQGLTSTYQQPYDTQAQAQAQADAQARANETAYWDDQANMVNRQMGMLDPQLNVGLGNINNSYNLSANRLGEQFGMARRDYNTGVQDTTRSMLNTRNNIATNTRNRMNALQRLLGISGSGNSSAAQEAAPYAALREGTQNLQGAQQTYGTNRRRQDTQWGDTERNYRTSQEDLDRQKYGQENSLRGSIAQTRAGLLDKLASVGVNRRLAEGATYQQAAAARAPYESQITSLLQQIAQLGSQFANPVLRTGAVSYTAPSLDQYALRAGRTGGIATDVPAVADEVDPALLPILARERDQYGNLIA